MNLFFKRSNLCGNFLKILSVLFILYPVYTFAQFTEFHPELQWYTIKGKHVEVHFHKGAERTAKLVAKIADEVWGPLTGLYHYHPETVHYVIKDIDDYSNGATYFFDNKIEIWASPLDFDLRGAHNWLRNVVTHELTHMFQLQSSMKITRRVPAAFLQILNYEGVRRPDILYGYPNFVVSYPLSNVNVPSWFAEGTAQYNRKDFDYDDWDTHRDMILRSYALDGDMLTWNQMGEFGKTSLGNESVYNSGFALTRYISQKYGEDKLREITQALSKLGNFTIDAAFEDVLGKDGNQIYKEWKDYVTKDYKKRSQKVLENLVVGDTISSVGFGNFYPTFIDSGAKFLYISNKNEDYFSPSNIYVYDLKTKTEKVLVSNVRSTVGKVNGKDEVIYSRVSEDNPNWDNLHDLYSYNIKKDKEKRLTFGLRANDPNVSHDGKKIVFLFEKDGTINLAMVDINGKNYRQITNFNNGERVFNPKFSSDDSYIVFGYAYKGGRKIAMIDSNGTNFKMILNEYYDDRNPCFDKDGNLIYASDVTGIFNLYSFNLNTKEKKQLTNVIGGTFMPSIDDKGNILYAGYTSTGYKIFEISPEQQKNVKVGNNYVWIEDPPLNHDKPNGDLTSVEIDTMKNYHDKVTPDYKVEKYKGAFSTLSFYPFIRYDNYSTTNKFIEKIKPGVIVSSSDMLDRYSLLAGGSIDLRGERDLFLEFDYRNKLPLLFDAGIKPELSLELYNISRLANINVYFGADTIGNTVHYDNIVPTSISYNLFEADLAAKQRIFSRGQNLEFRFIFSQYSALLNSFILPNINQLYPATNDDYLISRNFQITYDADFYKSYIDDDINPIGASLELKYNYEMNKFNNEGKYEVVNGLLEPAYNDFNFSRLELNSKINMGVARHSTLNFRLRAGTIFGPPVPDFFDFYLGGISGFRAYPFYSLAGNEIGWLDVTYRFPLFENIDARFGHLYLDKIFFSVFGDLGDAWNGNIPSLNNFKKGAGAEIRLMLNSYYTYPTSVFFSAAYGFDKFNVNVDDLKIGYGKEWRFYGGILFDFDF
jgi:Tol biopolymer transport system component